jgi:AraC-like DNA-binding protein
MEGQDELGKRVRRVFLQKFQPGPVLRPYIEAMLVQEDMSAVNYANLTPVKVLPTAMTVMGIQYGQPMKRVLSGIELTDMGTSGITGLQSGAMEYVSTGAIGTIIVQFKPGGLSRFTKYPVHEFHDANVPLELVFSSQAVRDMEEKLRLAQGAAERVGIVRMFLAALLREKDDEHAVLLNAMGTMMGHGPVSIGKLASELYMSRRTLERKFNALIGASPKSFAGILRFQQALRLRQAGADYLDIVQACGYADHAHFAKDFKAFAGDSPERFFRQEAQAELKKTFDTPEGESVPKQQMYY